MKKIKELLILFISFFKIGLFTFGGGQAMIPLIVKTCVEKRKWITNEEMIDMIAISESTPGVIAVNMATFCGYKKEKILGSFFATIGVVMPSFIIITLISIFYDKFKDLEYVVCAFKGIKCCVAILILNAGIKLIKNIKANIFSLIMLIMSFIISLFITNIKTIYIILGGLIIGLIYYLIIDAIHKKKEGNLNDLS